MSHVFASLNLVLILSEFLSGMVRPTSAEQNPRVLLRHPTPTSNWLSSVAASSEAIVAVGVQGTFLRSTNGTVWTEVVINSRAFLRGVAYGAGEFVAVGENGTILRSDDQGMTWTNGLDGSGSADFNSVAYGNDRFVAVAGDGRVAVGEPKGRFEFHDTGTTRTLGPIVHGGSKFVMIGDYDPERSAVIGLSSTDGTVWQISSLPSGVHSGAPVGFRDGVFVTLGNVSFYSTDAIHWSVAPSPLPSGLWYSVLGTSKGFLVVGLGSVGGAVIGSPDGMSWSVLYEERGVTLNSATVFKDEVFAVGSGGLVLGSSDTTNWVRRTPGGKTELHDVAVGDTEMIAVGVGGMSYVSTDGVSWVERASGVSSALNSVSFGNHTWVALGYGNVLLNSSNAISWTSQQITNVDNLTGLAFGIDRFVVVGYLDGGAVVGESVDGVTWNIRRNDRFVFPALRGVKYQPNRNVVVAYGDRILAEAILEPSQPIRWNLTRSLGIPFEMRAIASAEGVSVAVTGQQAFVSTNLVDWSSIRFWNSVAFYDVVYANGHFWIAGQVQGDNQSSSEAALFYSQNGLTWSTVPGIRWPRLISLEQTSRGLLAVSDASTIVEVLWTAAPPRFVPEETHFPSPSSFVLNLEVMPGSPTVVQASQDLKAWVEVGTFTNQTSRGEFRDERPNRGSSQFYRAAYR